MKKGFPEKLIESLMCQNDSSELFLVGDSLIGEEGIVEGELKCKKCGQIYEIRDGIVFFLDKQEEVEKVLKDEIEARDQDAKKYDEKLSLRYNKEVITTLNFIGKTKREKIIEYGCGTGRFTTLLSDYDSLLAIDFSLDSLKILQNKMDNNNIGLVLADATRFKTRKNYFDKALSFQVLEHVPTLNLRQIFYENVNYTLKKTGEFIFSAYHYDLRKRIKKEAQEGKHKSKIFFHYFKKNELKKELKLYFINFKVKFIDITWPFEARFNFSAGLGGSLSRFGELIPVIKDFGHLILFKAKKKEKRKIIHYSYGLIFPFLLKKVWFWFSDPKEINGVAMVNFFSYNKINNDSFFKTEGLTSVLDLDKSEKEIWENMRKKFIRKQIVRGVNNDVIVKRDDNFRGYKKIYNEFRNKKKLFKENFSIFRDNGILFSAYYNDEMIAGGVFVGNGEYIRAWTLSSLRQTKNSKMREIVGQANRMIIWEAIKYAKRNNYKIFDFGGIDPDSNDKNQRSLAEFKESFGGERKKCYYYYKVYSPILKFWMRLRGYKRV